MRPASAGAATLADGVTSPIKVLRTGTSPKRAPFPAAVGAPLPLNQILVGDCLEELARLPDACVDLVFADPPYNLQLESTLSRPDQSIVDAVDDDWDKFASFSAYDSFTAAWLAAVRRVMKPDATLFVIGSYHNIFRVGSLLQDQGFWILNDIVWRKTNPMPNFRGRRFTNAHETLIWAARDSGAKNYRFNYELLKAGNEDCQLRSDWLFPICTGGERLKDAAGRKTHPTQKPEALLDAHSARRHQSGRCRARSLLRLRHHRRRREAARTLFSSASSATRSMPRPRGRASPPSEPLPPEAIAATPSKRSEPRVAFSAIVEAGLIAPGATLFDEKRRHSATRARGRHDRARRRRRLDPQDRRAGAGPARLQRLDLLAFLRGREAGADRRVARDRARAAARSRRITGFGQTLFSV